MRKELHRKNDLQKAIDEAVWINFRHRTTDYRVGVIHCEEGGCIIAHPDHSTFEEEDFESLPTNYSDMSYDHIASIGMDEEPLKHWEEIRGMVSVIDGEILRFILAKNIPLEKLIRYELACRGHDKNHEWVGFEKAKKVWLE